MSKITSFCVVLLLGLTLVSAAQRRLNSISELEEAHRGERTNVLELLRWFANTVNICNNVIRLTFDPIDEYGSHHYGNYEYLLDPEPRGYQYYTVGNIHQDESESLPSYVHDAQTGTNGWNRARIIFSANKNNQINRVFVTQHYGSSDDTRYNPHFTFEITADLLQEFRRQHYTGGHQRGSYGNTSYFQGSGYSNQHRVTSQPPINNGMDWLCKFCGFALFLVVIFALMFISSSARMGQIGKW